MAQPLLARLHAKLSGLEIDAIAPPWVAPVLARMPEIAEVIEAPFQHGKLELRARWRLGRALRAKRYDQALVLPNSWKSALVPFFADIPLRSGYKGESRFGLLNLIYRKKRAQRKEPMPQHYARLSEAPGKDAPKRLPQTRLVLSPEEVSETKAKFGIAGAYAVLCPGAEFGAAKRWPYFKELSERPGLPAVILGSGNDAEAAKHIRGTNLAGKTTLSEAIALIAGARYVVSNDSGLMHVAAALGRPQLALFGSSSPEHTPPGSAASRVLWLRLECSPCYQRECPLGHFRCMREITVDRVAGEIENLGP
jgi:heptosyltransferase-2